MKKLPSALGFLWVVTLIPIQAQTLILNKKALVDYYHYMPYSHAISVSENNHLILSWPKDTMDYWFLRGQLFDENGEAVLENELQYDIGFASPPIKHLNSNSGDNICFAGVLNAMQSGDYQTFLFSFDNNIDLQRKLYTTDPENQSLAIQCLKIINDTVYSGFKQGRNNQYDHAFVYRKSLSEAGMPENTLLLSDWDNTGESNLCINDVGTISLVYPTHQYQFNQLFLSIFSSMGDSLTSYPFFSKTEEPNNQATFPLLLNTDRENNYYLLWDDRDGEITDSLKLQKYSVQGQKLGNETLINKNTSKKIHSLYDIAINENSHAAVLWEDIDIAAENNKRIYLQLINADGSRHGNEILIAENLTGSAECFPKVSFKGDSIYVVYQDDGVLKLSIIQWDEESTNVLSTETSGGISCKVHPNPATCFPINFTLHLDKDQSVRIKLYSLNGNHIKTLYANSLPKGKSIISWDEQQINYPDGVYIYEVHTNTDIITGKIIIQGN